MIWTDRLQRMAAFALAAVPAMILIAVLAAAAVSWGTHHQRVAALKAERETSRMLLRGAPLWSEEIAALKSSPEEAKSFFAGDVAAAAPQMQTRLVAAVTDEGGAVKHASVELKAVGDEAALELRGVVSFSAGSAQLTRILYRLRQERPFLFVDKLTVRGVTAGRLRIELVAVSYMWPS